MPKSRRGAKPREDHHQPVPVPLDGMRAVWRGVPLIAAKWILPYNIELAIVEGAVVAIYCRNAEWKRVLRELEKAEAGAVPHRVWYLTRTRYAMRDEWTAYITRRMEHNK